MIDFVIPDQRYEYDVRALCNEFFPGSKKTVEDMLKISEDEKGYYLSLGPVNVFFPAAETSPVEKKKRLKQGLYDFLSKYTGKTLPWGALTGVRPTKLAREMLDAGASDSEVYKRFTDNYRVSEAKSSLALEVAKKERGIIEKSLRTGGFAVYAGIPFCPSRCLYCSFTSFPLKKYEKRVDEYLDVLCSEIRETAKVISDSPLSGERPNSIYIGGGTPTTLSPEQLKRLLDCIGECFDVSSLAEGCVECGRPDSITAEKLRAIKSCGFIDRISVNPQTMNQKTLDLIGRKHTVSEVRESFYLARETGFDNINMDLIAGLPGEGRLEMEHTLSEIKKLDPENVTVHSLAIKRAAMLNLHMEDYEDRLGLDIEAQISLAEELLRDMGLEPYYLYRQKNMAGNFENVGYSKPGFEGVYNILIMEEVCPVIANGAGASTKMVYPSGRIERCEGPKDITQYEERKRELLEKKRIMIFDRE